MKLSACREEGEKWKKESELENESEIFGVVQGIIFSSQVLKTFPPNTFLSHFFPTVKRFSAVKSVGCEIFTAIRPGFSETYYGNTGAPNGRAREEERNKRHGCQMTADKIHGFLNVWWKHVWHQNQPRKCIKVRGNFPHRRIAQNIYKRKHVIFSEFLFRESVFFSAFK